LCEAFHCTPSVALQELEVCPWPVLVDVLEFRAYSNTRQSMEQHPDEYSDSDLSETVRQTQARLGREMVDAMR